MRPSPARLALYLPALAVVAAVAIPVAFVVARAADAPPGAIVEWLARPRTAELLQNTAALAATVVVGSIAIAFPLAWLVTRTDLPFPRLVTLAAVLPLAIPGYVLAYALRGLGGPLGAGHALLGINLPPLHGFTGAALALTLYNFPYFFLTFRAAFDRLDPAEAEAARALGAGPWRVLTAVHLPRFVPAALAGALVVGLYVLGDFGVVSLMRFETLSLALYSSWSQMAHASLIALTLVALTTLLLAAEALLARRGGGRAVTHGAARRPRPVALGWRALPAGLAVAALLGLAVVIPLATTLWWLGRGPALFSLDALTRAAADSLAAALPATALTVALALPVAWLARRPTLPARLTERAAQIGYAIPSLALALGFVVFALHHAPALRDSLALLWIAYAAHFLMLAIGPLRGTLPLLSPRHEEAARVLGCGPLAVWWRVTLPALRGAIAAGAALTLLALLKELPLARLLAPLGDRSLAVSAWAFADEALFADAAPYALALVLISTASVALVLRAGGRAA